MKRMLKKTLWAAAMALAASGSFAQEATADTWMTTVRSILTRAEVMADAAQARMSGWFAALSSGVWSFEPLRRGTVTVRLADGTEIMSSEPLRSRADATDEVLRARRSGEFARVNAEAHDFLASRTAS